MLPGFVEFDRVQLQLRSCRNKLSQIHKLRHSFHPYSANIMQQSYSFGDLLFPAGFHIFERPDLSEPVPCRVHWRGLLGN